MTLDILRLGVDFGLMILIWIVQIIIYPSFLYYSKDQLHLWHQKYTFRIAAIVIPLMLIQLFIYGFQIINNQSVFQWVGLIIVVCVWCITVFKFVPLHNSIMSKTDSNKTLKTIIKWNWSRTLLWTILCVYSLLECTF